MPPHAFAGSAIGAIFAVRAVEVGERLVSGRRGCHSRACGERDDGGCASERDADTAGDGHVLGLHVRGVGGWKSEGLRPRREGGAQS